MIIKICINICLRVCFRISNGATFNRFAGVISNIWKISWINFGELTEKAYRRFRVAIFLKEHSQISYGAVLKIISGTQRNELFKPRSKHCMKSLQIQSFSGPYFYAFGLLSTSPNSVVMQENKKQKNFEFGHFLSSKSCKKQNCLFLKYFKMGVQKFVWKLLQKTPLNCAKMSTK